MTTYTDIILQDTSGNFFVPYGFINRLGDVNITNPTQGQNLTYDAVNQVWKNTSTSATIAWGGITGTLTDQTDLKNALDDKYDASNPDGYTSNVGTVTKVNNTSPDANGNVSITIPSMNSTNNYVPYRYSASSFSNSTLMYNSNAMAFTGKLHIGSTSPGSYSDKGRLTIYDNTASQQTTSLALLNYGGGGGCGVAIDMYNTSANGGIPSGRFGLIDNGNYSGYLQLQVKKSGAASNPLLPAMNVVAVPATSSLTTCISFGQDEFNRVLFDLHKPEATVTITDTDKRWGGSGTTYSVTGSNKFNPRLLVAVGDIVSFDSFSTEATVTGVVSNSTTCQITTDVSLGTISNKNISVKKAYFKITDESNNTKMIVDPYGKFALGKLKPNYELDVVGTINASTDIKVNGTSVLTGITSSMVTNALGYTPYDSSNPNGYTSNTGTVTSVNNVSPSSGNVTLTASDIGAQPTLVSGTNIKTINNTSLLGSGDISVLQNKATGSHSLSLEGAASSVVNAINIGYRSICETNSGGIAIGTGLQGSSFPAGATASGANSIAIGTTSGTTNNWYQAIASGTHSIQIGQGTNSTDYTLSVGFNSNNYQLLDGRTGLIPDARISTNIARSSDVVAKTGDTMSGDLDFQFADLDLSSTISSNTYKGIGLLDTNGDRIGRLECFQKTNGDYGIAIGSKYGTSYPKIELDVNSQGVARCTFPNTTCADGGWVPSVSVLANAVSWTGGTVSPYSLSSYLPDDGQTYEVWVYGQVQTTATSGKFCRVALNSDIQEFMSLCCAVARSNASYWADGSAVMLVGSDRYLQQYTTPSTNAGGVITVVLRGYRRVGTNA